MPRKPAPSPAGNLIEDARRRLARLAEHRSVDTLRTAYDSIENEMARAAVRAVRGGGRGVANTQNVARVRSALAYGQSYAAHALAGELDGAMRDTQADAIHGLRKLVGRLEGGATPLDTPQAMARALAERAQHLLAGPRQYLAAWSAETQTAINAAISEGVRAGESARALVRRAEEVIESNWWKIERIARTETCRAFNAAQDGAVIELGRHWPDVYKRWTEHVDDTTGAPMDSRVGADSLVLHGQCVRPGSAFVMPSNKNVPAELWGKSFDFPPNRPNDRAVVLPWRPSWGIPGWTYAGGRKRQLRR